MSRFDSFKSSVSTTTKKGRYSKDEIAKMDKSEISDEHKRLHLMLAYRQKIIHMNYHDENCNDIREVSDNEPS